jgi:hypothetical protein
MGCIGRPEHERRLPRLGQDEVRGASRSFRRRVHITPELGGGSIDARGEPIVGAAVLHEGEPLVPSGRDMSGIGIGPMVDVLAEEARAVAAVVEPCRQGGSLVEGRVPAHEVVVPHACAVGIVAGQDACPGGAAERVGDEARPESDAPSGDAVEQRRHRRKRIGALVVGDDQQDVGTLHHLGRRGGRGGWTSGHGADRHEERYREPQADLAGGGERPDRALLHEVTRLQAPCAETRGGRTHQRSVSCPSVRPVS